MNAENYSHDGYLQRLVSRSIFLSENYTLEERRETIELLQVQNPSEAEDLKEVLIIVFNIIKNKKRPKYITHLTMWPTIQMVRQKLNSNKEKSDQEKDSILRAKLYR